MKARIASFHSVALIAMVALTFLLSGKVQAQSPPAPIWGTWIGDNSLIMDVGPGQLVANGTWVGKYYCYNAVGPGMWVTYEYSNKGVMRTWTDNGIECEPFKVYLKSAKMIQADNVYTRKHKKNARSE